MSVEEKEKKPEEEEKEEPIEEKPLEEERPAEKKPWWKFWTAGCILFSSEG